MVDSSKYTRLDTAVENLWALDWKVGSILQGDCYHAAAADNTEDVLVWVSRSTISEEQLLELVAHVEDLVSVRPCGEIECGIDVEGRAFVVFNSTRGGTKRLDFDRPGCVELRNRFLQCVAIVAQIHEEGIGCGNISHDSFAITSLGEPRFVGYFGGYSESLVSLAPLEMRVYLKPDEDNPGQPSISADVYALSVLGLELFGAQFPTTTLDPENMGDYLESLHPDSPPWVGSVLATLVQAQSKNLCRNAGEVLRAIAASDSEYVASLQATGGGREKGESPISLAEIQEYLVTPEQRRRRQIKRILGSRVLQGTVVGFLGSIVVLLGMPHFAALWGVVPASKFTYSGPRRDAGETALQVSNALERLQYGELAQGEGSKAKVVGQVGQQNNTDSNGVVAVSSGGAQDGNRLVRKTIDSSLLHLISNKKISATEQDEILRVYDDIADGSKGRLAAAFVEAGGNSESTFRSFLMERVRRSVGAGQASIEKFSTDALFLAAEGLSLPEVVENWGREKKLSDDEVRWLSVFHGRKKSPLFPAVAQLMLDRKLVQWPQAVFLEVAAATDPKVGAPYDALVQSATDGPRLVDSNLLGAWNAPNAVKALYGVTVVTDDTRILQSAITGIVNRPVLQEEMRRIVEVASNSDGEGLLHFAKLIGVLGLADSAPPEVVDQALEVLQTSAIQPLMLETLLKSDRAPVIRSVLRRFGRNIHPDVLIQLLDHSDPRVRKEVIPFLKDVTISSSRAHVRDKYYSERDPEVRRVFEVELFSQQ